MQHTLALSKTENNSFVTQLALMLSFASLTAIGAQVEIPSVPIPFTLQTFFVLLSGAILGKRNGAISQLLYLSVGIMGLPVFSSFGFGLAKLLGPTGGYLFSFPIVAFLVGFAVERSQKFLWIFSSMFASMIVLFTIGTLHLNVFYLHNFNEAMQKGLLIFSFWDITKIFSAAGIAHHVLKQKRQK